MEYYFGAEWRGAVAPSAATAKYAARVREMAKDSPHLLISHQYTRYLGGALHVGIKLTHNP